MQYGAQDVCFGSGGSEVPCRVFPFITMSPALARKVPWSSPAEFIGLFDLLFSSADPLASQPIALNHLYAWSIRSPSSLPPAIEATHALLSLILPPTPNVQQQRLGLAMALSRLVNSLVDPLQKGMYARSISQIAAELGLPLALVQLRHRATHEDLPSLTILLQSANLALDWLYTHYWLPRLNDIEGKGHLKLETIGLLEGLLISFKRARKRAILDTTQVDFLQFLPQIDHWIGAAARELSGDGSQSRLAEDDGQADHRPLVALCSVLVERQVLVPQAVKKRCQSSKDPLPEPLKDLYEPLIDHLAQSHPQVFIRSLVMSLLDTLSALPDGTSTSKQADATYYNTCASWLVYLLLRADGGPIGPEALRILLIKPNQYTLSVVERLKEAKQSDWYDEKTLSPLIDLLQKTRDDQRNDMDEGCMSEEPIEDRIAAMKQRWECLVAKDEEPVVQEGSSWNLVPEANWVPCPIGCLPDRTVPDLYKSLLFS
ncbi:uncharacterized protein PGTG_04074 [Puccinia graminis f. sp. tritici CRL 75-36-700-3]|uniref:rRNA-processing protein las1 n=1 Tax=Puccinia graminis f. sp. tritici (strain CRL 75-36-700-3 / race SCCL) TaxID=418459 RepID=E3K1E3_PUCGT|nr:uncharacterized protein PGTG_04074 [Puccinia graminis f. sp. tritici CRL 75-36-700-3]EFP78118.2 hypothetical protein PGTG_04074 [Puccinia graminis f. sp. tritici CRL 75-36-700-3]